MSLDVDLVRRLAAEVKCDEAKAREVLRVLDEANIRLKAINEFKKFGESQACNSKGIEEIN